MKLIFTILILVLSPLSMAGCNTANTQAEMNQCASIDFKKADAKLNKLFAEMEKRSNKDPEYLKLLAETKKAWVRFRDLETKSLYYVYDGSVTPMCISLHKEWLTNEATKTIDSVINTPEGDVCYARIPLD